MLDWMAEVGRAMREREPGSAAVQAFMAPGFELVDHRTLGYGAVDLPTLTKLQDARDDQVTDDRKYHRTREVKGNTVLAWYETQASAPDGGQFTWSHWVVWHRVAGLWARLEMFDLDDEIAARARFEELAGTARSAAGPREPENQLTRTWPELLTRVGRGDPDAANLVADDVVIRDRRAGVSAGTIAGRDAFIANAGAHFDVFKHLRPTVLAVRGDRLALIQMEFETDGFVSTRLNVIETNESGQLVGMGVFDEADFELALEDLDERFIAGEGSEDEYLIRRSGDFIRSMAQLDGAATLGLLDPEIEFVDHRPLGLGTTGIDGVRSILATRAEQVNEDVSYFRTLSVRGDVVLGYLDSRGVDSHGTATLYEMYWVSRFAAGKVVWNGWYDLARPRRGAGQVRRTRRRDPYALRRQRRRAAPRPRHWRSRFDDLTLRRRRRLADDLVVVDRRTRRLPPGLHSADELATATSRIRSRSDACSRTSAIEWRSRCEASVCALVRTLAIAESGYETGRYAHLRDR